MGQIKKMAFKAQDREKSLKLKKWFRANKDFAEIKAADVDFENGAIYGVSTCMEGKALGHGVWLDLDFIKDIVTLGNAQKVGVKCRFGHPNMSGEALGTFIGRFKNFRVEGEKAVADLYLDESAKKSPSGDLYAYILELAKSDPSAFGSSIVFNIHQFFYKKKTGEKIEKIIEEDYWDDLEEDDFDSENVSGEFELDENKVKKLYVSIDALLGSDLVDEPAANADGLFSALSSTNLHGDKFAVIATQFLDKNPNIGLFLQNNPHKITEFISRYSATKSKSEMKFSTDIKTKDGRTIRFYGAGNADGAVSIEVGLEAVEVVNHKELPLDDDEVEGENGEIYSIADGELSAITEWATSDKPNEAQSAEIVPLAKFNALILEFGKLQKSFSALSKRVLDLEETPASDAVKSKPKTDSSKKEVKSYSWDKEYQARRNKV